MFRHQNLRAVGLSLAILVCGSAAPTFGLETAEKRQQFQKIVTGLNADPKAMAPICRAIERIGYPAYHPEYMVLHGIHAFTPKPEEANLAANFDAHTTLNFLLTNYLNCLDVPASPLAPAQKATVAKADGQSTNPNPMKPGLYQVKSNAASQAPDLRNEEAIRLCFTPAMIAATNPVPEAGDCDRLNIVHNGNTTHIDFSCSKNGIGATGRSVETVEGDRRYSVIDLTGTDKGEHPLHLVTEMIFLGTDCNATVVDSPAATPRPPDAATAAPKPDSTAMHCAITQYQQWIRAQTQPPDPGVKARKLHEIDDLCGSALHLANVESSYEVSLTNAAATQSGTLAMSAPSAGVPAAESTVATAAPAAQSTKTTVHGKSKSKEIISSVLITVDDTKVVAMTSHFHYIFDIPPTVLAALKAQFHPYVRATFSKFHVELFGITTGTVALSVPTSAPDEALAAAIAAGFTKTSGGAVFIADLHGHRYTAGDIQPTAQYKLNQPYEIEVEDDLVNYRKPSPIKMAAGYLAIGAILLVVAPQVYTSQ